MNKTYPKKPNTQSGFSTILIFAALLLVVLAGNVAYIQLSQDVAEVTQTSIVDSNTNLESVSDQEQLEFSTSLKNEAFGVDIPVSENWDYVDENTNDSDSITFSASLRHADGTMVNLYTVTGKGGYCEPAPDDQLHSTEAQCPSYEEVSRESGLDGTRLIITKTTQPGDSVSSYQYCLRPSSNLETIEPHMGFVLDCTSGDMFVVTKTKYSDLNDLREDPSMQKLRDLLLKTKYSGEM